MINIVRDYLPGLPNQTEYIIGGVVSIAGTAFCYLVGGYDKIVEILLCMMIIDYISGIIAACVSPDKQLSSRRGLRGILKKMMILLIICAAHFVDYAINQDLMIRNMVILFFIGNEGLSLVENAANAGVPIPQKLKETLEQFTKSKQK